MRHSGRQGICTAMSRGAARAGLAFQYFFFWRRVDFRLSREQEEKIRRQRVRELRDSLRAKIDTSLQTRRREQQILEETWRRREEWDREELRFKTAAQQRADRRRREANLAWQRDVVTGIERFEQSRQPKGDRHGAVALSVSSIECHAACCLAVGRLRFPFHLIGGFPAP